MGQHRLAKASGWSVKRKDWTAAEGRFGMAMGSVFGLAEVFELQFDIFQHSALQGVIPSFRLIRLIPTAVLLSIARALMTHVLSEGNIG